MTPKINTVLLQVAKQLFEKSTGPGPAFRALTLVVDMNALDEPLVAKMEEICTINNTQGDAAAQAALVEARPLISAAFDRMQAQIPLCDRLEAAVRSLVQ